MISFQKHIWLPTITGTKEVVVAAESSPETEEGIMKFRETNKEEYKRNLSAVIYMSSITESVNSNGVKACWRKDEAAQLNGLVVSDFDHLEEDPHTHFPQWKAMLDFKQEGILKVFITPSGKGIKVVSKWRKTWGNLADNQLQIARMLGMEQYLDTSGKDASRAAFVPMRKEVLYEDDEVYTYFDPECAETLIPSHSEHTTEKGVSEDEALPQRGSGEGAFSERELAIIKALNDYYGKELPEGKRHATFCQQTAHWLLWLVDNNPEKAIAMAYKLDYVENWKPQQG